MENNKTAVDWYFDKIKSHFEHDGDLFETHLFTYSLAKLMEEQQHYISFKAGQDSMEEGGKNFEQYFEQTFKKQNEQTNTR